MDFAVEQFIVAVAPLHGPHARILIVMAPEGNHYEVTERHRLPRATRPPPNAAA